MENLFVGSVLESSCTSMYTAVLRSDPSPTFLIEMSFERSLFNTLTYAKQLRVGGVEFAETHAEALNCALVENILKKEEVEKMLNTVKEDIFKRSDERFYAMLAESKEMRKRSDEQYNESLKEFRESMREIAKERLEQQKEMNRMDQKISQISNRTIGILGSLIVLMGSFNAVAHHLFK